MFSNDTFFHFAGHPRKNSTLPFTSWAIISRTAVALMLAAFLSTTLSSAQQKSNLPPDCIKYMSYYQEDYKAKKYDDAVIYWRLAIKACPPEASQNMYIHGTTMYTRMYNATKDASTKAAIADTVLMLQNMRMEYFPEKRASILNNKAGYIVNYHKNDDRYLYDNLLPIAKELGPNISENILVNLMQASVGLYKKGDITKADLLSCYALVADSFDGMKPKDDAAAQRVEKASSAAGTLFSGTDAASCKDLLAIYTPKLNADPDNASLASTILRLLGSTEGCIDNDLYLKAATTVHKTSPSSKSAYALYKLHAVRDDEVKAVSYLEEAVAMADAGGVEAERMGYELAQAYYKDSQRAKAYEAAKKVSAANNGYSGRAYMLMGNIWASAPTQGDIERYARYWVAADFYNKAKAADESLKEEADGQLAQVSRYFPEASEMFMYSLEAGQGYDARVAGMYAHTTVRTRK